MASEEIKTEDELLDSIDDEGVEEKEEVEEKPEEKEVEEEEEKEEGEKSEEDEDIFKDLEEDEDTDKEDDLEGVPESATLTLKQIKAKFPDAIKEFPIIKNAIHKKEQYEEVFPDVKTAQEVARRVGIYENLHRGIIEEGDITPIIQTLKQTNPKILKKLAIGFTEAIGDVELANLTAEPVIRRHIKLMMSEAKAAGNKSLELAARYTARFLYGTPDGSLPDGPLKSGDKDLSPEVSEELKLLRAERERNAFDNFQNIQQGIINDVDGKFMKYIIAQIKSDDPEVKINEFVKESAARYAVGKLIGKLSDDNAHVRRISALWQQIRTNPQSASEVGPRLIRAFLGSAKPFLPALIAEAKNKALGTKAKVSKPDTSLSGGGGVSGKIAGTIPKGLKSGDIDYHKTSEDDLINTALGLGGKITLRKRSG